MSKVINLHPKKSVSFADMLNRLRVKQPAAQAAHQPALSLNNNQTKGIVRKMNPVVLRGWEVFCNELEFE